jgi:hypothetical protein
MITGIGSSNGGGALSEIDVALDPTTPTRRKMTQTEFTHAKLRSGSGSAARKENRASSDFSL